jgi:hypothetical protein
VCAFNAKETSRQTKTQTDKPKTDKQTKTQQTDRNIDRQKLEIKASFIVITAKLILLAVLVLASGASGVATRLNQRRDYYGKKYHKLPD